MQVIRLRRVGKKNKVTYRVVVAEHTYPVNGKFTADLGFYNPHTKVNGLKLDEIKTWLDKGAKPSNTVAKLLEGLKLKHKSIVVEKKNRKPKNEKPAVETKAEAPAAEAAAETEVETSAEETIVDEPAATEEVAEATPAEESATAEETAVEA